MQYLSTTVSKHRWAQQLSGHQRRYEHPHERLVIAMNVGWVTIHSCNRVAGSSFAGKTPARMLHASLVTATLVPNARGLQLTLQQTHSRLSLETSFGAFLRSGLQRAVLRQYTAVLSQLQSLPRVFYLPVAVATNQTADP